MTFQQLTYVVEISKCGSINKAARKLILSQSGISAGIWELEKELGIQLFTRSNRGVEFTPEGKEFLSYAHALLAQKQRIESLYGEVRDAASLTRFAVSTQRYPFSEDAFMRMLNSSEYNRFHFTLREVGMEEVIDDVFHHRSDIGIIFQTEFTEKLTQRLLRSRDLEFHELAHLQPCIYVHSGHPLSRLERVTVRELAGYPYVAFEHNQGVALDFSAEYQSIVRRGPAQQISVNNRSTMIQVLLRTNSFTTGSGFLMEDPAFSEIVTVPLEGKSDVVLGWIVPQGSKSSHQTSQFVAYLERAVACAVQQEDKPLRA